MGGWEWRVFFRTKRDDNTDLVNGRGGATGIADKVGSGGAAACDGVGTSTSTNAVDGDIDDGDGDSGGGGHGASSSAHSSSGRDHPNVFGECGLGREVEERTDVYVMRFTSAECGVKVSALLISFSFVAWPRASSSFAYTTVMFVTMATTTTPMHSLQQRQPQVHTTLVCNNPKVHT